MELKEHKSNENSPNDNSPKAEHILQQQLDNSLESLKDLKEHNTALKLQLSSLNDSYKSLKSTYSQLANSNKSFEQKQIEADIIISRLKNEVKTLQDKNNALNESETLLKQSIDNERLQNSNYKNQKDKDVKMIQDLTRQVKEMERILVRKHPDSVSALVVTANSNSDQNLSARKVLEDRIKQLELEIKNRDEYTRKVLSDVQDRFNTMKMKYESHIGDLESHVTELKSTISGNNKEVKSISVQTMPEVIEIVKTVDVGIQTKLRKPIKIFQNVRKVEKNEDAHLLATIRGLNTDLSNKEKTVFKLQREIDELKKVNKRLQRDKDSSATRAEVVERSKEKIYNPDEFRVNGNGNSDDSDLSNEIVNVKEEKDKLRSQLCKLEEDYQLLKLKRIEDLKMLQEVHGEERRNDYTKIGCLREQVDIQQVSINKLQTQLTLMTEQMAVLTAEKERLDSRLRDLQHSENVISDECGNTEYVLLSKKINQLEKRYNEREKRLHTIVHGLVQKQVKTNRECEHCASRHQQLLGYKTELDQIMSTLQMQN